MEKILNKKERKLTPEEEEQRNKLFGSNKKENLINYVNYTFDAIGLLIIIRINSLNRQIMQRSEIGCLSVFFESISELLWPKFEQVLKLNNESINLHSLSIDPKSFSVSLRPYYVVRRYAEFASALLALTTTFKDHHVITNLASLRTSIVFLIKKLSSCVKGKKQKLIFTISNYDQIMLIMNERDIISTETVTFQGHLETQRSLYVQLEITNHFSYLADFVKKTLPLVKQKQKLTLDKNVVSKIAKQFKDSWKKDVNSLSNEILFKNFSNFKLGAEILEKLLNEITEYNKGFWLVIKVAFGSNAFSKYFVADFLIADEFKQKFKVLN